MLEKTCFCCRLLLFAYDRSWISLLSFTFRNIETGLSIFESVKATMGKNFTQGRKSEIPSNRSTVEI